MDFIVNLQYEKPKISKYRQNADKQIEQEVQNIVARTKFAMAKDDGDEDAKVAVDDGAIDVYKRQHHILTQESFRILIYSSAQVVSSACQTTCSGSLHTLSFILQMFRGPVSYTHLDVYKRQAHTTRYLRLRVQ